MFKSKTFRISGIEQAVVKEKTGLSVTEFLKKMVTAFEKAEPERLEELKEACLKIGRPKKEVDLEAMKKAETELKRAKLLAQLAALEESK